ncbi:bifunctional diguanylate cyclase/phosphodiesterase [Psychromonas sp. SP041]|uniref:sensor domain-containing protein n=1 Tax=Psychromonas sp. SP041 TaxID=1365007 RepID=UPI00042588E5|nr:bifunctional diguanylate cyclase/phosphodiesterase [Psychromonas sp. SP041]
MLDFFNESLDRYRKDVAILTLKLDGTIIEANQFYLEIVGAPAINIIDEKKTINDTLNKYVIGKNIKEFDTFLANNGLAEIQHASHGHYHSSIVKNDFNTTIKSKDATTNKDPTSIEVVYFHSLNEKENIILFIKNFGFIKEVRCKLSFLSKIFKASKEGILITDASGYILCMNESFRHITGYCNEDVLGKTPSILNSGKQNKHFYNHFWQSLIHKGAWKGEIWNKRKDGETFPSWLNVSSLKESNGKITHYICQYSDISMLKKSIQDKETYTYYDSLTCLPNRTFLFEKLAVLRKSSLAKSGEFAILFCDLDRFKLINETYGDHVGDELLKCIANRLGARLRSHDVLSRSGDDEFIILIEGAHALKNIDKISRTILSIFDQPFNTKYGDFKMSMSIGISLFPLNSTDINELIAFSDVAMQKVKKSGGNNYSIFDPSGKDLVRQQHSLDQDIKLALERGEFEVWYQPQVNSVTHEVFGVECLLRWNHAQQGIISPNVFIPIVESNGMIKEIGDFVIKTGCQQAKIWQEANIFNGVIAINVSLRQLESDDFVGKVENILTEYQVDPTFIELEVTESLFSDNNNHLLPTLFKLKKLGIKLSLDDFGTGYSSLQRLKVLPVDSVKIDKCFVNKIADSKRDAAIINALIMISKTFEFGLIAEGIENKKQADSLNFLGCINHQGFLYSAPLRKNDFEAWLDDFNTHGL